MTLLLAVARTARRLRVDEDLARPFLTLWSSMPSVTDIQSDVLHRQRHCALKQGVVSSHFVVAFSANPDVDDAAAAFERMAASILATIKRVGPEKSRLDVAELIAMINARPNPLVRLKLIKRS